MNSMLDSLMWGDEATSQPGKADSRKRWLRRAFLVLTALFALAVLMSY